MKTMKRLFALLLCLVMVFSLAACAAKDSTAEQAPAETAAESAAESKTEAPAESKSEAPAEQPQETSAERPTLTIGVMQLPNTVDYETNDFTLYLEDSLNINLDFVYFSSEISEATTQLALMISGGERLPDILWGFNGIDINTVYEYGEDGYFIDLTDYFTEETAPNVMEQINNNVAEKDRPLILRNGKDPKDGKLYAFPYYAPFGGDQCFAHVEVNTKFMEKLGLSAPTTVDELYDFMKAVVENDPNGNGKADEIGAIGYSGYCGDLVQFIINAFVYCNDKYFFNATDGKVWAPYNTDEYRQALIYINKLVNDGLLNTATFTIPENGGESEIIPYITPSDETAIVGVVGGMIYLVSEIDNPVTWEYATPVVPLKAETDKGGYAVYNSSTLTYNTMITSDCEDPDLAFKLLDFFSHPDTIRRLRYGKLGVGWEECSEGTSAYGYPANLKILDGSVWSTQNNQTWHNMAGTIFTRYNIAPYYEEDSEGWEGQTDVIYYGVMDAYSKAPVPAEVVYDLLYNAEEADVVADCSQILLDYVKEARALFATGAMDPNNDADWQSYLDALEGQGLSAYTEAAQAAYSRMTGN